MATTRLEMFIVRRKTFTMRVLNFTTSSSSFLLPPLHPIFRRLISADFSPEHLFINKSSCIIGNFSAEITRCTQNVRLSFLFRHLFIAPISRQTAIVVQFQAVRGEKHMCCINIISLCVHFM